MSDQESRPQNNVRDSLAEAVNRVAQALPAVAPAHRAEHIIAGVLERHIDVGQNCRVLVHQGK